MAMRMKRKKKRGENLSKIELTTWMDLFFFYKNVVIISIQIPSKANQTKHHS